MRPGRFVGRDLILKITFMREKAEAIFYYDLTDAPHTQKLGPSQGCASHVTASTGKNGADIVGPPPKL
jgi:hypothetical protein